MTKICVYSICKNEENNIEKWYSCVKDADLLVPPCEISNLYDKAKYFCYEFTASNEKGVSIAIDGNCTLRYIEIVAKN